MRSIIALAILLVGLEGTAPDTKYQDRVQSDLDSSLSSILESRSSDSNFEFGKTEIDKVEIAETEIDKAEIDRPDIDGREIDRPKIAPKIATRDTGTADAEFVRVALAVGPSDADDDLRQEALAPRQSFAPADDDADETDADVADSLDGLCNALLTSAQENDLPVAFFANLIWQESGLRHDSVSRVGALGIAQFMPSVAVEVGLADPFDPNQAIPASARLLRTLRQHFGNLGYAAAAYNAGSHRVGQWLDHHRALPRETRNYVRRVTGRSVETWRKSPPGDSALTFVRPLPCRDLPAFAGLEQAQPVDPQQTKDALEEEKAAPRIGKRITRRIAARFAARFAQRRATATPAATTGVVAPAMIARNVHGGPRDAMRRPQHAPHERRRLAQALSAAPIP